MAIQPSLKVLTTQAVQEHIKELEKINQYNSNIVILYGLSEFTLDKLSQFNKETPKEKLFELAQGLKDSANFLKQNINTVEETRPTNYPSRTNLIENIYIEIMKKIDHKLQKYSEPVPVTQPQKILPPSPPQPSDNTNPIATQLLSIEQRLAEAKWTMKKDDPQDKQQRLRPFKDQLTQFQMDLAKLKTQLSSQVGNKNETDVLNLEFIKNLEAEIAKLNSKYFPSTTTVITVTLLACSTTDSLAICCASDWGKPIRLDLTLNGWFFEVPNGTDWKFVRLHPNGSIDKWEELPGNRRCDGSSDSLNLDTKDAIKWQQ